MSPESILYKMYVKILILILGVVHGFCLFELFSIGCIGLTFIRMELLLITIMYVGQVMRLRSLVFACKVRHHPQCHVQRFTDWLSEANCRQEVALKEWMQLVDQPL